MLLRQIEYFCAVCRTGSFTRAADACYVSQSAISQQVKALEGALGAQLLERHGRSFTPTPAGEHFYRKASDILQQLEDLRYETEGIAGGFATKLSFGYLNRYDGWEIEAAVATFTARHPHIKLTAVSGSHDDIFRAMMAGEVDLVLNDRRRSLSSEFENRFLFTGYDFIETSEVSSLSKAGALKVSQLKGETCVLIASPELEEVERTFYRDMLNFDCEFAFVRSREEGRMRVAGNHGFMPVELRTPEAAPSRYLHRVPLVGPRGERLSHDYYAFWPMSHANALVEEFAEILGELFSPEAA